MWRTNVGFSQKHQIFSTGESHASSASMSGSQFNHASLHPHSHEPLSFPSLYPSDHIIPFLIPVPYRRVDRNEIKFRTPNSILGVHPNGILSNGLLGVRTGSTGFLQPLELSELLEQRNLHSLASKAARSKRKMARQRSTGLKRGFTTSGSFSLPTTCAFPPLNIENSSNLKDLYTFCTPDKKKLRVLLKKELKNSDVGSLGRIVLPKREAEENLPILSSKEGIHIVIRDVYSGGKWGMRYRFWSNNKSRMYVLENVGDFVEQNGLETGDHITFYEDKSKNIYFTVEKAEKIAPKASNKINDAYFNYVIAPYNMEALVEEDSSLEILMEELQYNEEEKANSLMTLYMDAASSFHNYEQVKREPNVNCKASSATAELMEIQRFKGWV